MGKADFRRMTSYNLYYFVIAYVSYLFYYLGRKNLSIMKVFFASELGFTKLYLGQMDSIFSIVYGLAKWAIGILSDSGYVREILCFGLLLTGLVNVVLGSLFCVENLPIIYMLCGVNALAQACGWPACSRILVFYSDNRKQGFLWGFFGSSYMFGEALSALFVPIIISWWGWRYGFVLPGLICIGMSLVIWIGLREMIYDQTNESSVNMPSCNLNTGLVSDKPAYTFTMLEAFNIVVWNWRVWAMSIAYSGVYIIRALLTDWWFLFVYESSSNNMLAVWGLVSFNIGGVVGMLMWGWLADKTSALGYSKSVVIVISMVGVSLLSPFLRSVVFANSLIGSMVCMFCLGFCIFGAQMLSGLAIAEISDIRAVGSATGFAGIFAYLGSFIAGAPIGWLLDYYGWSVFTPVVMFSSIISLSLYYVVQIGSRSNIIR